MDTKDTHQTNSHRPQVTSKLQGFDIFFEYDKTLTEIKRDIKKRAL